MKTHYQRPSACGLDAPSSHTDDKEAVDCRNCIRTTAFTGLKEVARLTPEELNDLAADIVRGKTYIANKPDALRYSFGFLISLVDAPDEYWQNVGACYADWAEALPRGINGYPMFMTMRVLHIDDLDPLLEKVDAKHEALEVA